MVDLIEWFELADTADPPELPELPFRVDSCTRITSFNCIRSEIKAGPDGQWARNGDLRKYLKAIKRAVDENLSRT